MAALEENYSMKCKLAAIGLQPMADWVSFGCQHSTIPGAMIVACASMSTEYLDAVPQDQDQLKETPYNETKNLEDNLDNNRCIKYKDELEPCFRKTAEFGEGAYGEHCKEKFTVFLRCQPSSNSG